MIPQARRSNATCGDGVGRGHTPRNAMDASLEPGKGKKTESFFSRASEGKRPLNTLISACGNSFCISDPPPPQTVKEYVRVVLGFSLQQCVAVVKGNWHKSFRLATFNFAFPLPKKVGSISPSLEFGLRNVLRPMRWGRQFRAPAPPSLGFKNLPDFDHFTTSVTFERGTCLVWLSGSRKTMSCTWNRADTIT